MSPPKNSRNVTALPNPLHDFNFAVASSLEGTENLFANPEPTWCSLPPPIATVFVVASAQNCEQAQIRNTVATGITRIIMCVPSANASGELPQPDSQRK